MGSRRYFGFLLGCVMSTGCFADEDAPDSRAELLAAWQAFCDGLKVAGAEIIARGGDTEIDIAEGFQYLAMLTGAGIERAQYYEVNRFPIVARPLDGYKKLGLDSSDNTYRTVSFEPGGVYRIRGWRGDSTYLGFQVNSGRAAVANLNHDQMQFNTDGSFEVYLGGEQQGRNWLALPDDADNMYIREIFIDWQNETPTRLWIERLDKLEAPPPLTIAAVQHRFATMGRYVDENIAFWDGYVSRSRAANFNSFPEPTTPTAEGGSPDNTYSGGYCSIAPDEALLIEIDPGPARFWNIQLGNRWFQSLDYQYRQTSLNSHQARPDSDGRYRFVVAHRDPGVANWLDTGGHDEGVMYFRWNQAEDPPAPPSVTRVSLADIDNLLPGDTERLSVEQRQQVIRSRYEAVAMRFGL